MQATDSWEKVNWKLVEFSLSPDCQLTCSYSWSEQKTVPNDLGLFKYRMRWSDRDQNLGTEDFAVDRGLSSAGVD